MGLQSVACGNNPGSRPCNHPGRFRLKFPTDDSIARLQQNCIENQPLPIWDHRHQKQLFQAENALKLATRGSAAALNRNDIGQLVPGQAADFIGLRLERPELAGAAIHDPLASLVLCTPTGVDLSVINGRPVVQNGYILNVDLQELVARHNQLAQRIVLSA